MFFTEITDADLQQATLPRTTFKGKARTAQQGFNACRQKCIEYTFQKGDNTMEGTQPSSCKFFIYDEVEMEKGKTERLCVLAERTYWGYMNDETLNTTTNFWNSNYYSGDCPNKCGGNGSGDSCDTCPPDKTDETVGVIPGANIKECQRPDGTKLFYDEAPYTTKEREDYAASTGLTQMEHRAPVRLDKRGKGLGGSSGFRCRCKSAYCGFSNFSPKSAKSRIRSNESRPKTS